MFLNKHRLVLHVLEVASTNLRMFSSFLRNFVKSMVFQEQTQRHLSLLQKITQEKSWFGATHIQHMTIIFFCLEKTKSTLTVGGKNRNSRSNSLSQALPPHASLSLFLIISDVFITLYFFYILSVFIIFEIYVQKVRFFHQVSKTFSTNLRMSRVFCFFRKKICF